MTAEEFTARADDLTFGILHSRFHELWSLRYGSSFEERPGYALVIAVEIFPFPAGMKPRGTALKPGQGAPPCMASDIQAANIAAAARQLKELRENWNPPEETDLKKRTSAQLYNVRPTWLDSAHQALDKAVAEAYGWTDYTPEMPDEEILRRLLALSLERKRQESDSKPH